MTIYSFFLQCWRKIKRFAMSVTQLARKVGRRIVKFFSKRDSCDDRLNGNTIYIDSDQSIDTDTELTTDDADLFNLAIPRSFSSMINSRDDNENNSMEI